ncbi:MAG: heat-inducible transcription repressor HrcA [Clostridia bacterium]|nr:heat-inducible transcription repressor HrcA [Clostridia bacterium]
MNMNDFKERKKKILQVVIRHYVRTARPAASGMIVRDYDFPFSSATVRNVLAELEEEGYLTHPYTSAGRIPTDKGYRFYVDRLMEAQKLTQEEERHIAREYRAKRRGLEEVMRQTSKMLSLISHQAGFILTPTLDRNFLKHIELVALGGKRILAVLVIQAGLIRHKTIQLNYDLKRSQLYRISKILNEKLSGLPLSQMREEMNRIIEQESNKYLGLLQTAKGLIGQAFTSEESEIYLEGSANILASVKEDLYDYAGVGSVFRAIEEKRIILDIVRRLVQSEGVKVLIGKENLYPELKDFSVVSSTYKSGNRVVGALGIIGPKRMEYPKMVALVDFVAKVVNNILNSEGG